MSAERINCTAASFDAVRCQSSAERIQNIAAVTFSSVSEVWGGQSAVFVLLQLRERSLRCSRPASRQRGEVPGTAEVTLGAAGTGLHGLASAACPGRLCRPPACVCPLLLL